MSRVLKTSMIWLKWVRGDLGQFYPTSKFSTTWNKKINQTTYAITAHQGPLSKHDRNYKGSIYNFT